MVEIEIPDSSLILLIGPSGAGKSTFASKKFQPTQVISSDRCRAMICDDESNQGVTREAFSLLHRIAWYRLAAKKLAVIDATNLQKRSRTPLLRIAAKQQAGVIAIVFHISFEKCLANNRLRPDRKVDENVIRRHIDDLNITIGQLNGEGYHRLYKLNDDELNDWDEVKVNFINAGPS